MRYIHSARCYEHYLRDPLAADTDPAYYAECDRQLLTELGKLFLII